jgi:hypothetical protein
VNGAAGGSSRRQPAARELTAFIDESGPAQAADAGSYMLAAALCEPDVIEHARDQMRELRLRGQIKLHWRNESHKRRLQVAETVSRLDLVHLVVVREGSVASTTRPERRRRACLERMLYELDQWTVAIARFESRGPADDRRDRAMLDALRARRTVGSDLRIDHVRGPLEPLLWIPDAVCGAVRQSRAGDSSYLQRLGPAVEILTLTS